MILKKILYNSDVGQLLLRLAVGGLMLFHGVSKLNTNIIEITNWIVASGLPGFFAYGVYIGEVIAPLFIICGLFVRLFAAIFSFNMLVATFYLYVHGFALFALNQHGGLNAETDMLYLLASLALVFLGGGNYGLSSVLQQKVSSIAPCKTAT